MKRLISVLILGLSIVFAHPAFAKGGFGGGRASVSFSRPSMTYRSPSVSPRPVTTPAPKTTTTTTAPAPSSSTATTSSSSSSSSGISSWLPAWLLFTSATSSHSTAGAAEKCDPKKEVKKDCK